MNYVSSLFNHVKSLARMLLLVFALMAGVASSPQTAFGQTIICVDATSTNVAAPGVGNTGSSWATAYKYLQNGLKMAFLLSPGPFNKVQIWVRGDTG